MRKLYTEFFCVPKHGKVRENVMIARVAVSVVLILICMAAMSFTAYAFFSHSVTSGIQTLKAAHFALEITPPDDTDVSVVSGAYTIKNESDTEKTYDFKLTKSADAQAGYCAIVIATDVMGEQEFFTQPIGTYLDENGVQQDTSERTVHVVVPAGKTVFKITFIAEWGTCAVTPIEQDTVRPAFEQEGSTTTAQDVTDTTGSQSKTTATSSATTGEGAAQSTTDGTTAAATGTTTDTTTGTTDISDGTTGISDGTTTVTDTGDTTAVTGDTTAETDATTTAATAGTATTDA